MSTALQLAEIRASEARRVADAYREQVARRVAVMRSARIDPVLHAAAKMEVQAAQLQHDSALLHLARANHAVYLMQTADDDRPAPAPAAGFCHGGHMCGQPSECRRNLRCTPAPAAPRAARTPTPRRG